MLSVFCVVVVVVAVFVVVAVAVVVVVVAVVLVGVRDLLVSLCFVSFFRVPFPFLVFRAGLSLALGAPTRKDP